MKSGEAERTAVVLVLGYRYAGKSLVLQHLEQAGYVCVDNLPVRLLAEYLAHPSRVSRGREGRVAIAVDLASQPGAPAGETETLLGVRDGLKAEGRACALVFIAASETALSERSAASRPLEPQADGARRREEERHALAMARAAADLEIDSSWTSPIEERDRIMALVEGEKREARPLVDIGSFGYKHGSAQGDVLIDVRYIPNPYYVASLRKLTGLDRECADYVLSHECARATLAALVDLATAMEAAYTLQGRPALRIRIGCTGGQHRSVAMAEALGAALKEGGLSTLVSHRELATRSGAQG